MSSISSISSSNPASATGGINQLSSQDFLRVMLTELAKQDPLAPSDTKEILNQVGTIRSIEANLQLSRDLTNLVRQNQSASATNLIGTVVTGRDDVGSRVTDLVRSVSVTREGPVLNLLSGRRMPMSNLEEVIDPALEEVIGGAVRGGQAS